MENLSGLHPVNDLVLVRMMDGETKSAQGIAYPDAVIEREAVAQIYGFVVEMGPKCLQHPATSKAGPGTKVVIAKFAGLREQGLDGNWYRLVRAEDVIAYAEADSGVASYLRGRVPLRQTIDNQQVTA